MIETHQDVVAAVEHALADPQVTDEIIEAIADASDFAALCERVVGFVASVPGRVHGAPLNDEEWSRVTAAVSRLLENVSAVPASLMALEAASWWADEDLGCANSWYGDANREELPLDELGVWAQRADEALTRREIIDDTLLDTLFAWASAATGDPLFVPDRP